MMTAMGSRNYLLNRTRVLCCAGVLALTGTPFVLHAQSDEAPQEMSDKGSEDIQQIYPLFQQNDWNAALPLIEKAIADVKPDSYDFAIFNQLKAQALNGRGNKEDSKAIMTALENAINNGKLGKAKNAGLRLWLSQIYYEQNNFDKAQTSIEAYLNTVARPIPDATSLYIYILYGKATANPKKTDLVALKLCEDAINKSLLVTPQPTENTYTLLLACLQQAGKTAEANDLLELLAKEYPTKKDYWQQLASGYLNLGIEEKDKTKALQDNVRAIVTIERAQAMGFMKEPKDNLNLVSIYYNLEQYGRAAELLEAGLKSGAVENAQTNWVLLSNAYQEMDHQDKAIATLDRARKFFPQAAQLDYLIGFYYLNLDKSPEAFEAMYSAARKGGGDNPSQTYSALAYLALDLKKLDAAKFAIDKASQYPENEQEVSRLRRALNIELEDAARRAQ